MGKKITIVTPVFNSAKTIERTINSVLNQSYKNIEYIIIDGGSTDGTVDMIKKYEDKISYWVSEKDAGQADAINKGFKKATGDIVAWLNGDDEYLPDIFNEVVKIFESNKNLALVYGNCYAIFEDGTIKENIPPTKLNYKKMINFGNFINQPSSFYNRKIVEEVGYLDDKYNYWMEYDLFIKLLKNGKGFYLNKFLSNFYISAEQKSDFKNIVEMDKELRSISLEYGGKILNRIFLRQMYNRLRSCWNRKKNKI